MMEGRGPAERDTEMLARAKRHLLRYGGDFVDFVPVRAEGACWISPRAR
jgi:2,2-dialkylglycine decarboxylase (pyruvate)